MGCESNTPVAQLTAVDKIVILVFLMLAEMPPDWLSLQSS